MVNNLSIVNADVRLGGAKILTSVRAEIEAGEFIGIFGPNGAGKSTLVKCIMGLVPLTGGQISVFGYPAGRGNRLIGYMPQTGTSLQGTALSAFSIVAAVAGGNCWGFPWHSEALKNEVTRVLELSGALEYAHRPFSVLSGGEKHRIALAQALLGKPKLLILDEPLANLDPRNQMHLVECVRNISDTTGAIVLLVAHDINPLLYVMDRVLYIAGGRATLGRVDEVVTSRALSTLYRTEIDVIRAEGRIFIVAAEGNVTEAARHA